MLSYIQTDLLIILYATYLDIFTRQTNLTEKSCLLNNNLI